MKKTYIVDNEAYEYNDVLDLAVNTALESIPAVVFLNKILLTAVKYSLLFSELLGILFPTIKQIIFLFLILSCILLSLP